MPAPRRKRLPTDFFDRLLSNQTDDQINELLDSLVDEQIAPTPEAVVEETPAPAPAAPLQKKRPKDYRRDAIEDSIVTRDESLEEEVQPAGEEIVQDELIPRTARMQARDQLEKPPAPRPAAPAPPREEAPPAAEPAEREGPGETYFPPVPEPPAPPAGQSARAAATPESKVEMPEWEAALAPPEPSSAAGAAGTEAVAREPETPTVDLTPPPAAAEEVTRIVGAPAPGQHGAPAAPASPATAPPVPPAAPPETAPEPEIPLVPLPTHEELKSARRKSRWQQLGRKPKLPKLAKPTPSISFPPAKAPVIDLWPGAPARRAVSLKLTRMSRAALLFLLPAFLAFSLFSWYPMLKGLVISFYHYAPVGPSHFLGVANYARAFHDSMFWATLWHALGFCVMALAIGFWIPVFIAIFLNELRWGKGVIKFLFFLPFLMPTVPAAILWKWIMDQGFGLLNALVALLPVANAHIGWLNNPNLALLSIVLMYVWKNTGWAVLIYSAALTNLDETLYEEAEIDGANLWNKIWHVTLPSIRGVIAVMFIITIINTLQIFTEVYILTNGGPMNSTEVIATYIYKQAFFNMDIGYAAALSVILLVLLLIITIFRLRRLEPEGE